MIKILRGVLVVATLALANNNSLFSAIKEENVSKLKSYIQSGGDVNELHPKGESALNWASYMCS